MKKYLLPLLYTLIIIIIGSLISSILYYFNITSAKINTILIYLFSAISLFVGSYKLGIISKKKGIISGLIYFIILLLIILLINFIFIKQFNFKTIIYYFILLLFSISGSIIGKNKQKEN